MLERRSVLGADRLAVNLSDTDFWAKPRSKIYADFEALRRDSPISWFPASVFSSKGFPTESTGYWAVTRHADINEISRRPDVFSSQLWDPNAPASPELQESARLFTSMVLIDDPAHARLRKIVQAAFTPRRIAQLKEKFIALSISLTEDMAEMGEFDFVEVFANRLPIKVICELLGIPETYHNLVIRNSDIVMETPEGDIGAALKAKLVAGRELSQLMEELVDERRAHPKDDLITNLVTANRDGDKLTDDEVAAFFILLSVAGNETTRNALSEGVLALSENPQQRSAWQSDFDTIAPTAIEEILRWATPVRHFTRVTTTDTHLSGTLFRAGDPVLLFFISGNRDETVFEDPLRFDLYRKPNRHQSFGGSGPHFCLGAYLARLELDSAFREMFRRLPSLTVSGEPTFTVSNYVSGIKRLPCISGAPV